MSLLPKLNLIARETNIEKCVFRGWIIRINSLIQKKQEMHKKGKIST